MTEQTPRMNVTREGDVTIIELTDRKILDEINIAQIGEELTQLADQSDAPKLLIDFASVSHMSSSALGMLITLHKRIREKGGELRFCNIQPAIYEVFVITRLNEIFRICRTRAEAIESLS